MRNGGRARRSPACDALTSACLLRSSSAHCRPTVIAQPRRPSRGAPRRRRARRRCTARVGHSVRRRGSARSRRRRPRGGRRRAGAPRCRSRRRRTPGAPRTALRVEAGVWAIKPETPARGRAPVAWTACRLTLASVSDCESAVDVVHHERWSSTASVSGSATQTLATTRGAAVLTSAPARSPFREPARC